MIDFEQVPAACRTELLFVAAVKRWLLSDDLPVADRLAYLEWLASRTGMITPAVVAAIEPADDTALEIIAEAVRLSLGADDNGTAMFAVLDRPDVFRLCWGHAGAA
jgi:hypothetical protein